MRKRFWNINHFKLMLRMHLEGLLRLKAPALFNDISKAEAL